MNELQLIIGINKRNPLFTVNRCENKNEIQVYYGAVLHEVIVDEKDNPELKLMLARLYNAGVKVKSLIEHFGYSYPTLKRWGKALKQKDFEILLQTLSGKGVPKKVTTEIKSFVNHEFKSIYPDNKYSYSKIKRENIKDVFLKENKCRNLTPYL